MMKFKVSLGKIHQLKGQQPQPRSHKYLAGTVKTDGKAFSHIRPVRCRGQRRDEERRMTYKIRNKGY